MDEVVSMDGVAPEPEKTEPEKTEPEKTTKKAATPAKPRPPITDAQKKRVESMLSDLVALSSTIDETEPDSLARGSMSRFVASVSTTFKVFVNKVMPMHRIMSETEHKFGSGVATYYHFMNDIISINGVLFLLWISGVIVQWFHSTQNSNRSYDALTIFFNFLGLNGPRLTDDTWFYYSGYGSVMAGYDMGLAYSALIITTYGFSLLFILLKIRSALLGGAVSETQEMYQLPCVLYSWDWGIDCPSYAQRLMDGTIMQLKGEVVEMTIRNEIKAMRASELAVEAKFWNAKRKDNVRKGVGALASFGLLAGSLVAMAAVLAYSVEINTNFSLLSAIIINIINMVIPMLQKEIVKFEHILDPAEEIRQEVVRIYFIKMANIVFLVFQTNDIHTADGGCVEFVIGSLYIQLFIIDLVVNFITTVIVQYALFVQKKRVKVEFIVSNNIIDGFYRQCIAWIGSCYSPMMFFYGTVCNFLVTWMKFEMMKRVNCPPLKPLNKGGGSSLFRTLLLITLIISAVPTFFFMQKNMYNCGPHVSTTPLLALTSTFTGTFGKILYWLFHPMFLFIVLVITLLVGYIRSLQTQAKCSGLTAMTTELEAEVVVLRNMLKGGNNNNTNGAPNHLSPSSVLSALRVLHPGAFTDEKDGCRLSEIYAFVNGAEVMRAAAAVVVSTPLEPPAVVEEL